MLRGVKRSTTRLAIEALTCSLIDPLMWQHEPSFGEPLLQCIDERQELKTVF